MFTFTTTQNIYKSGLAKVYFHYYTKDLQSGAHPCILELEVNKWLFTGADVDPALQMPFPRVGRGLTRPWKWILENKKKSKSKQNKTAGRWLPLQPLATPLPGRPLPALPDRGQFWCG
jgi:hypothetical protein